MESTPPRPTFQSIVTELGVPLLLTVVALICASAKPQDIDDYVYVRVAMNVAENPLDPYHGLVHWTDTVEPLFEVNENPPLLSYLLAIPGALFAWNVVAMHVALIPVALLAVLATWLLARELGVGRGAPLSLVASPFFLLSASSLMCETLLTALLVVSVVAALRAQRQPAMALVAGALCGLAFLTKFSAVFGAAPIFLALLVRTPRAAVLFSAVFASFIVGFELWTWQAYGMPKFIDAVMYAPLASEREPIPTRVVYTLMLGGLGAVGALAHHVGHLRILYCALLAGAAAFIVPAVLANPPEGNGDPVLYWLHGLLFLCLGGVLVFALWRQRAIAKEHPILPLMVLSYGLFSAVFNWCANGRSVLPAIPFLCVWLSTTEATGAPFRRALLALSLALSAALLHGSVASSAAYSTMATTATQIARQRPHLMPGFLGHWGFQSAMEANGFKILDLVVGIPDTDGLAFVPRFAGQRYPRSWEPYEEVHIGIDALCVPWDLDAGAGFYFMNRYMPLPIACFFPFAQKLGAIELNAAARSIVTVRPTTS